MRINCAKSVLVENINIVSKAVSSKATLPILECCLLVADGNGFRLMATDTELAIETKTMEADIVEKGAVALDSKVFFDIIRRLPGDEVEIYADEKNLTLIKSDKSEFKILGMDANEFPELPKIEMDKVYRLSAAALRDMIRQTIFSVSHDITKPVLCGELLDIDGDCARLVSVDGFRISMRRLSFENGSGDPKFKIVIPGKTLSEISKILPVGEEALAIMHVTDRHVLFNLDNCIVVSRLIEGDFINYETMFAKEADTTLDIDKTALLNSIDRATLISKDSKKSPVKLKLSGGRVVITSNTEVGASYEEIWAEQDGPDLEIAFNPKYIVDVLKVLDCERIIMEFTTALSPCIIKVAASDDYRYLILPLRLRN